MKNMIRKFMKISAASTSAAALTLVVGLVTPRADDVGDAYAQMLGSVTPLEARADDAGDAYAQMVGLVTLSKARADDAYAKSQLKAMSDCLAAQQTDDPDLW